MDDKVKKTGTAEREPEPIECVECHGFGYIGHRDLNGKFCTDRACTVCDSTGYIPQPNGPYAQEGWLVSYQRPWGDGESQPPVIVNIDTEAVCTIDGIAGDWVANAHRICACVNACKDIPNPEAVPDVVKALEIMEGVFRSPKVEPVVAFAAIEKAREALKRIGVQ